MACAAVIEGRPGSAAPPDGASSGLDEARLRAAVVWTVLPAAPARAHQVLRLTRRGRGVVLLLLLAVLLFAAFSLGRAVTGNAATTAARPVHTVVVGPGDTLWSIARASEPQADPRDVVADLVRINHLSGGSLSAGQALLVPGVATRTDRSAG